MYRRLEHSSWGISLKQITPLAPAGTLRFDEIFKQCIPPTIIFTLVLLLLIQPLRFNLAWLTDIVTFLVAAACLFLPALAFFVTLGGIIVTINKSVARSSAVIFWIYWPFWKLVMCIVALVLAICLGNYLWFNNFQVYQKYGELQAYDNVDSYTQTGNRLQDAGLVRFNASNGVDRRRGGCIVNGDIYCVAPIMQGGVVKKGVSQTKTGYQDLFMAGINCCNCPITDFRCGDWNDPNAKYLGGMRLLDEGARRMYRLAAEKWMADWDKQTVHNIFFHWDNDPIVKWKGLWSRGVQLTFLSIFGFALGSFLFNVVLNGLVRLLMDLNIAVPIKDGDAMEEDPLLANEKEQGPAWVPELYHSYENQKNPPAEFQDNDTKFVVL